MRPVEGESAFAGEAIGEFVDQIGGRVDDGAAGVADDVHVIVVGRAVGRRAVTEVGVPHQADLLEQFEVSVDRRDVDSGDCIADLLRRRMPQPAYRVENLLALRGHAQPARAQRRGEVDRPSARSGRGIRHHVHGR